MIAKYSIRTHSDVCIMCISFRIILFSIECQGEDQLGNDANTVVTVNGAQINHDDLFNFNFIGQRYCVPTDIRPPTFNISFSSSVLITQIGIRGIPLPLPLIDQYVQSFSLSYVNGGSITNYSRANGLTVCSIYIVYCL